MTDDQLASFILIGLRDTQTEMKRDDPTIIAQRHGVHDRSQINRVCEDLHARGLITDYWNVDSIVAKITGAGVRAIS